VTEKIDTIAVVGLGYIGLPTAAMLASQGFSVIGVDTNEQIVAQVARGEVPFVEPDLGTYLAGAVSKGQLTATAEMPEAQAYIVAVPTPFDEDRAPDLRHIFSAADAIAPRLRGGELIVLESTSPPGATEEMAKRIFAARPDLAEGVAPARVDFVHCPERVLPGRIMIELATNDRIIGGLTVEAAERARGVYETFCEGEILITDARTAEMTKLVENAYRDVNIALANELSIIAEDQGIDVWKLISLANHHPRVNILAPGPGVGGHCIAVDPWFIVASAPNDARLIRCAREVNDAKPHHVVRKVVDAIEGRDNPTLAVLGIAYKANVDDTRESPSLAIVRAIIEARPDSRVLIVDPHVQRKPAALHGVAQAELCELEPALAAADVVVALVAHDLTMSQMRSTVDPFTGIVVDACGAFKESPSSHERFSPMAKEGT